MYQDVTAALRAAYDQAAGYRDIREIPPWKVGLRQEFLELLRSKGKTNLLEVGAGPGRDSLFFQQNRLNVVSTDLSPEMVRLCREKGLEAYEMDFLNLDFPDDGFDAVYAMSALLHVPKANLADVLLEIRRVLAPGGLFFYGVYGGIERDEPWEDDDYVPQRHFTFYLDHQIIEITGRYFFLRDFKALNLPEEDQSDIHYQRLILQKEAG